MTKVYLIFEDDCSINRTRVILVTDSYKIARDTVKQLKPKYLTTYSVESFNLIRNPQIPEATEADSQGKVLVVQ